ncbi:MAG: hypothetical protein LC127_02175 [Chitinophagales bacterium]|nr:hypothetical protein [Chitinophagales bacterium]
MVVPESAAFEQQGATYVYKVTNDTIINVPVKVIARENNMAVIGSGVQVGDKVVGKGVGKLRPKAVIQSVATPLDSIVNAIKPVFRS